MKEKSKKTLEKEHLKMKFFDQLIISYESQILTRILETLTPVRKYRNKI